LFQGIAQTWAHKSSTLLSTPGLSSLWHLECLELLCTSKPVHLINCSHATRYAPRSHGYRCPFCAFLTGSGRSGSCFQASPGPHPPHGICIRCVAGQGSAHHAETGGTPEQEPQRRSRRESLWESIRMARFPRHPEPMAALADPSSGPSNHLHPRHARAARQRSPVWGRLPSKLKLHSMVWSAIVHHGFTAQ
jgi:hypothetical protein